MSVPLSGLLNTTSVHVVDAGVYENVINLQAELAQRSPSAQM